jgi:hypothetical protein
MLNYNFIKIPKVLLLNTKINMLFLTYKYIKINIFFSNNYSLRVNLTKNNEN